MRAVRLILCVVLVAVITAPSASASVQGNNKPRVMVDSFTVEGGGLVSGTECELKIVLRNMSTTKGVSSVQISGSWSNSSPPPVEFKETNQVYVSNINPAQTREVVLCLVTKSVNISALDSVSLYLDINYSYDEIPENTNSLVLRIPVGKGLSEEFIPVVEDETDSEKKPNRLQSLFSRFGVSDIRLIYIGGSLFCALVSVILISLRYRRK